ncbi:MAG: electron transport complex subunit RsxD [Pseudomonadota bacterium]|jgi:electron transport complex protein RnfD
MMEPVPERSRGALSQAMLLVLLACLPGASAFGFFFGWGVVLNILWLGALAVALEAVMLQLRAKQVVSGLRDCTALVSGVLLALALPPAAPWWLGFIGIFAAIVIAKHLYGGTGRNVLNPAMAGYALLLLVFPVPMTRWLLPEGATAALPSLFDALLIFLEREPAAGIDAFTGATTLDSFRHQRGGQLVSEFIATSPVMGKWSGLGWEWINTGFLMGGMYLLYRRVIAWQIPVAILAALALWSLLFHDGGSSASGGSPLFHFFAGATMIGAFFIATDPATAPASSRGKLIYGALIGSTVYLMRRWGAYADGVAFAVLLGNLATPIIEVYARRGAKTFPADRKWILTVAAALSAILLVMVMHVAGYVRRPDAAREALSAALPAIMPDLLHDNDLSAASFTLDPGAGTFTSAELLGLEETRSGYRATLAGDASGVILPLRAPNGYGGPIDLLIGIDANGLITGVRVLQHGETRGFGDRIETDVSNWILGFDRRSLENTDEVLWAVKKDGGDFDQFVGATITPRAVTEAVHNALLFFEVNRDVLLQP